MKPVAAIFLLAALSSAQVYSPQVLKKGQIDASDLGVLAPGIYEQASALTPRQKAEAIWRFFLTDGRFVKPGFWYHIAGWAYEEPAGEVLDPVKLLNSYGFGLCYHIAPLLEAVYEAGGFEDARVWFLTGHTVAEVFYDGAYHYFDSDMMGYNAVGEGDPRGLPVASVHQIEEDGGIMLGKLKAPRDVDRKLVEDPWYPADVREAAIGGLAELFTSTQDNRVFPFTRYALGHSMQFTLRPGERLIRYFRPEAPGLFYLPYKRTEKGRQEFPEEVDEYHIRTADGPKSQKDERYWSTGRIEYTPVLTDPQAYYSKAPGEAVFDIASPYVIIRSKFSMRLELASKDQSIRVETSTDGGKTWTEAGQLAGPFQGEWSTAPHVEARSEHGPLTAVTGHYQYLVKLRTEAGRFQHLQIVTWFQMNPRTLAALTEGANELDYHPGPPQERWAVPAALERIEQFAYRARNIRYVAEHAQGFVAPRNAEPAEIVFELAAPDGAPISGFDAGGRFLDIRNGEAPDKFTAEVRKTAYQSEVRPEEREASLAWSTAPGGPYTELWRYDPNLKWKDGIPIDRTLRWPEVFRQVRALAGGSRRVYVRYRLKGLALDNLRAAVSSTQDRKSLLLEITHLWHQGGEAHSHVERIREPWREHHYTVTAGAAMPVTNDALILYCPPSPAP
jgi:hypothetical protein